VVQRLVGFVDCGSLQLSRRTMSLGAFDPQVKVTDRLFRPIFSRAA
jgi:hypothetical protein